MSQYIPQDKSDALSHLKKACNRLGGSNAASAIHEIETILRFFPDLCDEPLDEQGSRLLHIIASEYVNSSLFPLLIRHTTDISQPDANGETPLQCAFKRLSDNHHYRKNDPFKYEGSGFQALLQAGAPLSEGMVDDCMRRILTTEQRTFEDVETRNKRLNQFLEDYVNSGGDLDKPSALTGQSLLETYASKPVAEHDPAQNNLRQLAMRMLVKHGAGISDKLLSHWPELAQIQQDCTQQNRENPAKQKKLASHFNSPQPTRDQCLRTVGGHTKLHPAVLLSCACGQFEARVAVPLLKHRKPEDMALFLEVFKALPAGWQDYYAAHKLICERLQRTSSQRSQERC
jgi:hypothetical protein